MEIQMNQTPYKTLYWFLALFITIFITLIPCSSQHEPHYANCSQPFRCGDPSVLGGLRYPFWGINRGSYCGEPGFELKCVDNTPFITNSTCNLRVIGTNPKYDKMTVAMADFSHTLCPSSVLNRKLTNVSILELSSGILSLDSSHSYSLLTILYGCPPELGHQLSWSRRYPCSSTNDSIGVHFVTHTVNISLTSRCLDVAVLPILQESAQSLDDDLSSLVSVLDQGFEMKWFTLQDSKCESCMGSGGQYGFDRSKTLFTCYCPDNTYPNVCPPSIRGSKHKASIAIGTKTVIPENIAAKDHRGNKVLSRCFVTSQGTEVTNQIKAEKGKKESSVLIMETNQGTHAVKDGRLRLQGSSRTKKIRREKARLRYLRNLS